MPTLVEIGPSNASQGQHRRKEAEKKRKERKQRKDIYIHIYIYILEHCLSLDVQQVQLR